MGLPVQRAASIALDQIVHPVDFAGQVVKAFRPQKVPVPGSFGAADQGQVSIELRMGVLSGKAEMPAAAFGVETGGQRDGFQQGGFSAAVFAYQKSDRALLINKDAM